MNDFEAQLLSQPVNNNSLLDLPAAIDYFIITEISKNPGGSTPACVRNSAKGAEGAGRPTWGSSCACGIPTAVRARACS